MTLKALVVDFGGVLTDPGDGSWSGTQPPMFALVGAARASGLRTALLSNADGGFQQPEWAEFFDQIVVSGVVGVAKPDPEVYLLTASRLGLAPEDCVFVDDLRRNVDGAVSAGMVGVHHRSVRDTAEELEAIFERALRPEPL